MPVLKITSNSQANCDFDTLKSLSESIAELLEKPESYVMVSYQYQQHMIFAGTDESLAFCELKSLGLNESQTTLLSKHLCSIIEKLFNIKQERIYIEFSAPERSMFGWDARTF